MLVLAGGWGLPQPGIEDLRTVDLRTINVESILGPLVDAANLAGYTLYPVDVPGFRGWGEWEDHYSLRYLAHETGGLAMINALRVSALAEAVADTRTYYWLGFEPPRNEDDEGHEVEVRVDGRPKLRVRSRRSYLDMSRSTAADVQKRRLRRSSSRAQGNHSPEMSSSTTRTCCSARTSTASWPRSTTR